MPLDADAAYLALCARDARFDGRLFVGVTSTGIYCRPVCRVRTPRRENCRFFGSRALAEAADFRPCLKCRPEIAPGLSAMDSSRSLADSAAAMLDDAVHDGDGIALPAVAARLGVTDRHLRRIFQAAHGVAPRDYLATQRLLLAKQLLTDTDWPVTQVALAAGFDSQRRFNAAFAERYRLAPTQLRGRGRLPVARGATSRKAAASASPPASTGAMLKLAWRAPYDVPAMLGFLQRRALRGVESVDGPEARRTLSWSHHGRRLDGWLATRFVPAAGEVHLQVSGSLAPVLGAVLRRVRQALDLDADSLAIDAALATLPLPPRPGVRVPGAFDGFEMAVRVILGQQVTVAAARTLTLRLVEHCGSRIETPWPELTHLFPDAATIAAADPDAIGRLGIVRQRVRALQALAVEVADGRIALHRGAPLEPTLAALRALPGIGEWTAQLIALRALGWPDAWPAADIGLMLALGTRDPKIVAAVAEPWRPWRAYALMRLWTHLEESR